MIKFTLVNEILTLVYLETMAVLNWVISNCTANLGEEKRVRVRKKTAPFLGAVLK